jgi:hypothetical protein
MTFGSRMNPLAGYAPYVSRYLKIPPGSIYFPVISQEVEARR